MRRNGWSHFFDKFKRIFGIHWVYSALVGVLEVSMGYPVTFHVENVPLIKAVMRVDAYQRLHFDEPELLVDGRDNQFLVDAWESVFQPVPPDRNVEVFDFDLPEAHLRPADYDVLPVIVWALCLFSFCHRLFHGYGEIRDAGLEYMYGGVALRYRVHHEENGRYSFFFQEERIGTAEFAFRLVPQTMN